MPSKTKYKFIYFERIPDTDNEWFIKNTKSGDLIGAIEYYPPWKQYVFNGDYGSIFSGSCLLDIVNFLQQLNKG